MKEIILYGLLGVATYLILKTLIQELIKYGFIGIFKAIKKILKYVFYLLLLPFIVINYFIKKFDVNKKVGDMRNEKWWK